MSIIKKTGIFTILFLLLLGCESQITTECESEPVVEATFSSIQKLVFNQKCLDCHSGSAASGNLDLSEGKSYANLVNVNSSGSTLKRVVPGNSDQSYLIWRLQGTNGETLMPPGNKLPASTIKAIIQWIDDGAEND